MGVGASGSRRNVALVATTRFWTVPAGGGPEAVLAWPRGHQGKLSPDGRRLAYLS